jgi:hypothetical protein
MFEHQTLDDLGSEADRTIAEQPRQDFRHSLAGHPLDMIDRSEVDDEPTAFNAFFVIEGP